MVIKYAELKSYLHEIDIVPESLNIFAVRFSPDIRLFQLMF